MDSFKISKVQYGELMKIDRTNAVNLFLYLLANADEDGTLNVSLRTISKELGVGLRTVRTLFDKFQATHRVTHQATHQGSVLTICGIDSYRGRKRKTDTPSNTPSDTPKTIAERKKDFSERLKPFLEKYGRDMLNDFYLYWVEANENGKMMRFEKETTWDTSLRLARWYKNNKERLNHADRMHHDGTILHEGQMDVTKGGW